MGSQITSIGNYAFYGCYRLDNVTLPESVVSIGDGAFRSCRTLKSVEMGSKIETIGTHAFYDCNELTVYTAAESAAEGWSLRWNSSYRP